MNSARLSFGAWFIVAVLAIGAGAWGWRRLEVREAVAAAARRERDAEMHRLHAEHARLQKERNEVLVAPAISPVVAPPPVAVDPDEQRRLALRTLTELKQQRAIIILPSSPTGGRTLRPDPRTATFSPAFAELFGVTAVQFQRLQQTLVDTRKRLEELAVSGAAVRHDELGVVAIEVRISPEEAAVCREQLRAVFMQAMQTVAKDGRLGGSDRTSSDDRSAILRALGRLAGLLPTDF